MFTTNRYVRRDSNSSGKFKGARRLGVERCDSREYEGYHYQIGCHRIGITVRQVRYSVSIIDPNGQKVEYRVGLPSRESARRVAEQWIDAAIEREDKYQRDQALQLAKRIARLQAPKPKISPTAARENS